MPFDLADRAQVHGERSVFHKRQSTHVQDQGRHAQCAGERPLRAVQFHRLSLVPQYRREILARHGSESRAGVHQEEPLVAAFHASLDQQQMADADGRDGGERRISRGESSKGVNCRTPARASTPIRKRSKTSAPRTPSAPVVRLRPEISTRHSSKARSPKRHGARQGDLRFSRAGFAETAQAGSGDGLQIQVPGRAGIDHDAARAGIQQQAEGLAAVDPRRDQDAGLREVVGRNPLSGNR